MKSITEMQAERALCDTLIGKLSLRRASDSAVVDRQMERVAVRARELNAMIVQATQAETAATPWAGDAGMTSEPDAEPEADDPQADPDGT